MGSRAALAAVLVVTLLLAAPAPAATTPRIGVPVFGGFNSVLAQGEGHTVNSRQLAHYEATGQPPRSFISQQHLYAGVMPVAGSLTAATLDSFYKDTDFGQMPGGVGSVVVPPGDPGAQIYRDRRYQMAHIYATTRAGLMYAAGYDQAAERLFLMDVIRRLAEGRLAGLLGPSAARGDAAQLTNQDFSPAELDRQYRQLPVKYGAPGKRAHDDIKNFVAGINAYINQAKMDPLLMPAEYAALGTTPAPWKVSDTAAEAVFLVTQFTVSNGSEEVNQQLQEAFQRRFGHRWRQFYADLREANDPEALTVAKVPFHSDNPGRYEPRLHLNPWLGFGSIKPRNPEIQGPSAQRSKQLAAHMPGWVRSAENLRTTLPHVESNALMVSRRLSADGHALAAMGPQVGYYSPQIFVEYELHGGGLDSEGVTFPGASPWPLIGHGIDFAWSGTSANGDNEDTFVERLCNRDGSPPSDGSTHYMYKGRCIPFLMRKQTVTTPYSPLSPKSPPRKIVYQTKRSVHGPVFAYATVHGRPVALTVAKAVDFHELSAAIPFMELSENQPSGVRQFMRIMGRFPGSENWFYVDHRDVGWIQSGIYPKHARHSSVELPWWGDGRADWQCFNPRTYTACYIPASHRPHAVDPRDGFIISWNNVEAHGWHPPPTSWDAGPLQHALILQQRLAWERRAHHGHVNLSEVARDANQTATTDLRGLDDYPWMRRVIGRVGGTEGRFVRLMDAWRRSGSQRVQPVGSNVYRHSAAIALFDAWWPRFVTAEFQPTLGRRLMSLLESQVLPLPAPPQFSYEWTSQVQKDLRSALGAPERGRYSHIYCGGPWRQPAPGLRGASLRRARAACRRVLLRTLSEAISAVSAQQGPNPAKWKVLATCPKHPHSCDQEVPTTAGAVDTPPFPWQDRGTYHQVVEVMGHR